jgi:DNA repair exonuclease SbcCD ATPase subunit
MVSEVETILNEIRERVRADQEQHSGTATLVVPDETSATPVVDASAGDRSRNAELLNRLAAHLTTTTRAWDRLPPLYSNRAGMAARLELWIKARLKSLSRWFTWEQVNFNAAVHHALSDTLEALRTQEEALRAHEEVLRKQEEALRSHEHQLMRIRTEARNEAEARLAGLERSEREIQALRANIEAQAADVRSRVSSLITQTAAIEARVSETNAAQAELNTQLSEIRNDAGARISNMAKDIDGRLSALAADLRDEQRVCFKQLSLEASEAAVLEDRGRRAIESRLEKLEQPGGTGKD